MHWGRRRVIGVGNDALGQVINLPQCGLTCPNAANVPRCDSRRPGGRGARATGSVLYRSGAHPTRERGARGGDRPSVLAMRAWHNPDSSPAPIAARSSILKGRRKPHPTPLNQESRLHPMTPPPGGRDFPLKVRHRLQNGLGPALTGALSNTQLHHDGMAALMGRGSAPRGYSYPPGVMGWPISCAVSGSPSVRTRRG